MGTEIKKIWVVEDKEKYVKSFEDTLNQEANVVWIPTVAEFQDRVGEIITDPPDYVLIDLFLDSIDENCSPEEKKRRWWALRKRTLRQILKNTSLTGGIDQDIINDIDPSIGGNGLQIIEIIKKTFKDKLGLTALERQFGEDRRQCSGKVINTQIIRNYIPQIVELTEQINTQISEFMKRAGAFSSFRVPVLGNVGNKILVNAGTNPELSIDKR